MFCATCGNSQPVGAAFCVNCGAPTAPVPAAAGLQFKVEYDETYLVWPKGTKAPEYTFGTPTLTGSNRGDIERQKLAEAQLRSWVNSSIGDRLSQGWMLDGAFDASVRPDWVDSTGLFNEKMKLRGAWVRLRRYHQAPASHK